jgi:F0F1-type ATP synthase assembly protein I
MMIVFTVIGLILGVLIPRHSAEAGRPAESSTAAAGKPTR